MDARTTLTETPLSRPTGPVPVRRRFTLSPINRRRWDNFKRNRRGYIALWFFAVLFVISLFAEFIANDKPLYVRFNDQSYFPVFVTYPDTTFGEKRRSRSVRHRGRLPRPVHPAADREKRRLDHLAADPVQLRHTHLEPARAVPLEADLGAQRG